MNLPDHVGDNKVSSETASDVEPARRDWAAEAISRRASGSPVEQLCTARLTA
jgi:hypothetical protein